jgi:antitoxin CptB
MTNNDPDQNHDDSTVRRLKWRSRRGMLELELALLPFVEQRLAELSTDERMRYEALLDHDDWDIFEWLQGRGDAPDPALAGLIDEIRRVHGGL